MTTNKQGVLWTDTLEYGTYTLKQISAPEHYMINTQEYTFDHQALLTPVVLQNKLKEGQILLTLTDNVDTSKLLSNADFELYNEK